MSSDKPIQSGPNVSNETWETTAQRAKAEASTVELSDEVDKNARREAEAAKQAADAAPVRPRSFKSRSYVWLINFLLSFEYRCGVMLIRLLGWAVYLS